MERGRVLTVEEALALPPPSEAEVAERRAAIRALAAIGERVRERLGRPLTSEEFEWSLRWDDEDSEPPAK
jgi:hypothetical protein